MKFTQVLLLLTSLTSFAFATNFVIILADDLGRENDINWDYSTVESPYPTDNTPYLRKMAMEGKLLNRTYAQPVCCPSRAALNSGLRPTHPDNGVFLNDGAADSNTDWDQPATNEFTSCSVQDFAQTLKNAGYKTASIGKYRTSKDIDPNHYDFPLSRGYDVFAEGGNTTTKWRYYPLDPVSDPYLGSPYTDAYTQADVDRIYDFQTNFNKATLDGYLLGEDKHLTDALEAKVEDTITDFITNYPTSPFLVYWAPHAPHGPFKPRQDLVAKYGGNTRTGLVEGLDQAIGRLLDFLVTNDLQNDTLVLFLSDNGAPGNYVDTDIVSGSKTTYMEGGIRTPAIAWQPNSVTAGGLSDKLLHFIDIHATLADIAGVSNPPTTEGISFKTVLYGGTYPVSNRKLFYHVPVLNKAQSIGMEYRFKLVWDYAATTWSIYNIRTSHQEDSSTDLPYSSLSASQKQKVDDLCDELVQYLNSTRSEPRNWITWKSTGLMLDLPDCSTIV